MKKFLDKIKRDKIKRGFIQVLIASFILQMSGLAGLMGLAGIAQAAAPADYVPADHLVISEVQVGGDTADDEFVELYNPTSDDVIMENWRLARKTSTGAESNLVSALDGTVFAHGFFLIAPSGDGAYDDAVAADKDYSTAERIAANNTVILYSDAGITKDKVGMGTAQDSEGAAAENPDANGSIERKPGADYPLQGNGIDTDDNSADFQKVTTSNPQNSSSAIEDPNAPAAPTSLTATDTPADEGGSITLTWIKSTDDGAGDQSVTGYNIYRRQSTQAKTDYRQIGAVSAGVTKFVDQTAVTGTDFIYQIEAVDGAYSALSAESTVQKSVDNLAPRISDQTPADKAIISNATPTISANLTETGSGVDTTKTILTVDGIQKTPDISDESRVSYTSTESMVQGKHLVDLTVADVAGNSATAHWQFTVDTIAPKITSLIINSADSYTKTRKVVIESSVSADAAQMRLSEDKTFKGAGAAWVAYTKETNFTLSEGYGKKNLYFQVKDAAGNISAIASQDITYIGSLATANINPPDTKTLSGKDYTLTSDNYHAWLEASDQMVGTSFASVASYKQNPGADLPADIVGVGQILDFSVENSSAFPTTIRIYYTAQDLAQAQVLDESQILGLYYWDTDRSTWQSYPETGVNTTNFNGYEGFVWAVADHLTPVVIAADIIAPNNGLAVQNLRIVPGDGKADLSWDKAEGATGYLVRYKEKDGTTYQEVALEGGDITTTVITGLNNETEYQIEVAAKDRVGNLTPYASATATPQGVKEVVSAPPVALAAAKVVTEKKEEKTIAPPQRISNLPQVKPKQEIKPKQEVKGEEKEKEVGVTRNDRKRLMVALVILVIAIAAGVGGYYAYEWWVSQPEKEPTSAKTKNKKKNKSNGRW